MATVVAKHYVISVVGIPQHVTVETECGLSRHLLQVTVETECQHSRYLLQGAVKTGCQLSKTFITNMKYQNRI